MKKIKAGIIGATGYTGLELYRLLHKHQQVDIIAMSSRTSGKMVASEFPNLIGNCDLSFVDPKDDIFYNCDIIFFATPHGVAMQSVAQFLAKGIKIIDLGADFRIQDTKVWSSWYGMEHTETTILKNCIYGLPEVYEDKIKQANIVANPGCYPTAIMLSLKPLLENNLIDTSTIIADCKSGVSGAGRGANIATLLCESSENITAYGVNHHRHKPEIEQELSLIAKENIEIIFVPHLIPMQRGMLVTIYVDLKQDINIFDLFKNHYKNDKLVYILANEIQPQTKSVRGTNNCQIGLKKSGSKLIITTVIDNLIKGASGQAVQNMNLMFGFDKNLGLNLIAINP